MKHKLLITIIIGCWYFAIWKKNNDEVDQQTTTGITYQITPSPSGLTNAAHSVQMINNAVITNNTIVNSSTGNEGLYGHVGVP